MAKHHRKPSHPSIERARRLANLLDSAFKVPVINKTVGLDPILGLVPGGGDVIAGLLAAYPIWVGHRLGLPQPVLLRMGLNVALDIAIGAVPLVGDVADIFWKSNQQNLKLLEEAYERLQLEVSLVDGEPVINVQAEKVNF